MPRITVVVPGECRERKTANDIRETACIAVMVVGLGLSGYGIWYGKVVPAVYGVALFMIALFVAVEIVAPKNNKQKGVPTMPYFPPPPPEPSPEVKALRDRSYDRNELMQQLDRWDGRNPRVAQDIALTLVGLLEEQFCGEEKKPVPEPANVAPQTAQGIPNIWKDFRQHKPDQGEHVLIVNFKTGKSVMVTWRSEYEQLPVEDDYWISQPAFERGPKPTSPDSVDINLKTSNY